MSYLAFGTALALAGDNVEELARLKNSLRIMRKRAKTKADAQRIENQMHALRYVEVRYSQSDLGK